jgi:hypothetical protein
MLQRLNSTAARCYVQAAECERLASLAVDAEVKASYLRIANRWRSIAEHYEYIERTDRFLELPRPTRPRPR